ncbi:hypothetical protein ACC732_37200, partial [Rhizobium ruizarguesonis]
PAAAPLTSMRIVDGTDRLLRAPTTTFRAAEVGLDAFGYNFPNKALKRIPAEISYIVTAKLILHPIAVFVALTAIGGF